MRFVAFFFALFVAASALEDSRPTLKTDGLTTIPGVSLAITRSPTGTYELVVRNDSRRPVWYSGYGADAGSPCYSVEILKGEEWSEHFLGWCGVGLGESRLAPKKELRLDPAPEYLPISAGQKFRILMSFSQKKGKNSPTIRIYSNEALYIPAGEEANQPPEPMPLKRHGSP